MKLKNALRALFLLLLLPFLIYPDRANAEIQRLKFEGQGNYLIVELLADDLVHVEYGRGSGPGTDQPLEVSEMVCQPTDNVPEGVCKTDYPGPTEFSAAGNLIETKDVRLEVDSDSLSVALIDKTRQNTVLTTFRPLNLDQAFKGLIFTRPPELDLYGLGQQFVEPGNANIDWEGRVREGGDFGNIMAGFNGGANGNTQIPVLYAVKGASTENYALFLDNKYKQRWDFTGDSQWQVEMFGHPIRFYIMTGPDLLDLRKDYMGLVGHPLVPPKRMFGLWVSEYGFDRWEELESKLVTLRDNRFPLDGFVLDLQWFGGIPSVTGHCAMGTLDFDAVGSLNIDPKHFPDPAGKLVELRDDHGVGIMLIEEAYVCDALPEHGALQEQGCLVRSSLEGSDPVRLCGFFGCGGMIDYTNDECSRFWHDRERRKLIDLGVLGHWTDLGEPEVFNPGSGYHVGTQADAHNIFNFRWLRGIYQGYQRNDTEQRPFMMSRSGAAGIQRFGSAMWSGDISSRPTSLAAHAANQMHMSFSGIDYYGADIGGFHRNLEGDLDEMYTQWYAYGMMFDIPGRPHVENLCNCKETAPDRIGSFPGNRENTELRYSLVPYLYSLAHRAYRFGEPVMPPLVMYYQTDDNVRNLGDQKLIGRDLMAGIVAEHGETQRDIYLPRGTWIDWRTGRRIVSEGITLPNVQVAFDGIVRLPLYARAGALVPLMHVDQNTLNALGERRDGEADTTLVVRAFPPDREKGAASESAFTLYEDDGKTIAYQDGAVRTTAITQKFVEDNALSVTVVASEGSYEGAPDTRNALVALVTPDRGKGVSLNGTPLPERTGFEDLDSNDSGWTNALSNAVLAKSGPMPVDQDRDFRFTLEQAPACTSSHQVISVPGDDNGWTPADPARELTTCRGKTWVGQVTMFEEEYKFAADRDWTVNWGSDGQQNGPNFPPLEQSGIYDVTFNEEDAANPVFHRVGDAPPSPLRFICQNGHTVPGISVYVVGSIPELGVWDPNEAVELEPDGPYPTWTGMIPNLPREGAIEWKCIKRKEEGDPRSVVEWEPGSNNLVDRIQSEQVGAF